MSISFNPIPGVRQFFEDRALPSLADARDTLRDGVVSTWNQVPGNEVAESVVGDVADALPFNNVSSASFQALAGVDTVTLDQDATLAIQRDPSFVRAEADIIDRIKKTDGYGERPMTIELSDLDTNLLLELGGERGAGSMTDQARNAWDLRDPDIRATWGVAGNELTWLLRHARLDGTAHIGQDGSISIDYRVSDTLDLRSSEGRSGAYNTVSDLMGTVWHDMLGAKETSVTGTFTRTV